jgi:low temperature requirement protein LtrA
VAKAEENGQGDGDEPGGGAAAQTRGSRAGDSPELFFDLAFVVTFFQLSNGLTQHMAWRGALQTLVLLLAVWFVWFVTAKVTDRLRQRPAVQLLVIVTMLGSLVMVACPRRAAWCSPPRTSPSRSAGDYS